MRNGLNAGIVFGIITVFLVLIGFTVTASDLVGTILHIPSSSAFLGLPPGAFNLLVFLFLLGVWAGVSGVRKIPIEASSWKRILSCAGLAGLIQGLLVGGLALLIGSLFQSGVRMSVYFAQLLPAAIRLFLIGLPPVPAAIFFVIFFFVTGLLGGVFTHQVLRGSWRPRFSVWLNSRKQVILGWSGIQLFNRNKTVRMIVYGVVCFILLLSPLAIGDYWNYTVGTVGIYVLLGLGLNIVVGLAGLLDLGYVAFFAIGGYTVALLTAPAPHHLMWSFWVTIPIGIVLAAFAGVVLGVPVLRLRGDYLAIVTLGFGQIIAVMLRSDALTNFTGGPKGVSAVGGPNLFGHSFGNAEDYVYLILLAVVLVIIVTIRLRSSRVGRAWEAIREDETVASAMGINTLSHKLLAFAIGAAFAGLGGVIFASRNQFTGPEDYNLMVSFNVLASVIVGGMGSVPGVVGGAFTLKGLPEVLRELENYRVLAFGALLVVMMLIRPEGLLPTSRRKMETKELHDPDWNEAGEPSGGKT
jgi:ABC-type branched-subunit amino acid transport system permease subunit